MDYNYYLRRSAPRSNKVVINNITYDTNNQYDYLTYDYSQPYENNNYSFYGSNTTEYSPYSQTTVELKTNLTNNIYNNFEYGNQGFSYHTQNYFSQPQRNSSYPQEYNSQPQNYYSYPQENSNSNKYNNNYTQYNYDNFFTNENNYQNNNYNYNDNKNFGNGDIIYYDQYGNEIKRKKNPDSNNFNNYYQGQGQNKNEFYPYSSDNQNNLIQNTTSKTDNEQNLFSEEQIKKWLQETENQNNTTNANIKAKENQNDKNYSNTNDINTNTNINTFKNQNTENYNNITTNNNNHFNTNNNFYSTENTSTNNINTNNNSNNALISNTNLNNINNNNVNNNNQIINNTNTYFTQNNSIFNLPKDYYFFTIGLYNIGSTCYMNATLQCLLHVSPLISYFKNLYPKNCEFLRKLNNSIPSKGYISNAFFDLIRAIFIKINQSSASLNNSTNNLNPQTSIISRANSLSKAVSPENFQKTLGRFNPQFKNLEANDSKDLILYLLQVMHQELNYFSKNIPFNGYPNQYDRAQTFCAFIASYDKTNYSIISDLFYGTYENVTKCAQCNLNIYNFQKFEFLSFGVSKYQGKEFNIMNGFDDYTKIDKLTGDNQYYCNKCKKLCDAEIQTKLIWPPKHLLINIDYGKNKKYMPSSVKFDEEIDITKYINFDFKKNIKYRIIGVCSHLGDSGISGHYIAFCKNTKNKKWYKFNDSIVSECINYSEIVNCGTPYLLLYEQIN